MSEEQQRKAFEKRAKGAVLPLTRKGDSYADYETACAWEAWQMAWNMGYAEAIDFIATGGEGNG
jgi:hypothetical protein